MIGSVVLVSLLLVGIPAGTVGANRPEEPAGLQWLGCPTPGDLDRFPDEANPGWLEVSLPIDHPTLGGAVGLVVVGPEGLAAAQVLCDGRRPPHHPIVWTVDPPEDGRGGPPGYFRFVVAAPASGRLAIKARLAVRGPARPLRVSLRWWVIDSPAGADTIEIHEAREAAATLARAQIDSPFVTALGGPEAIRVGPLLQVFSPRAPIAGRAIRLLGSGLEQIGSLSFVDHDGAEWQLERTPDGLAHRYVMPTSVVGSGFLLLDGARASFTSLQVCGGAGSFPPDLEPLWNPVDGEVLVVAADDVYGGLAPLLADLSFRGLRASATSLSLVTSRFDSVPAEDAIRCAVSEACGSFKLHPLALILVGTASEDNPANDILPTLHVTYEHEFPGYYDTTYAEDAAFGDLVESVDLEPELLVGRIPVRTAGELASYVAKLQTYRAQPPQPRLLLAVGDATINHDNSDRRRAAASLLQTLQEGGVLSPIAQYASAYQPLSVSANRQRALSDFQGRLAGGAGVLDLFGNNTRATNMVHMFESPPGPQMPWLLAGEMPTAGKLPIALFHTCLNGAFDEDAHFVGSDSPAEAWVREPSRGVIACLAQTHITTFFDDWELADRIYRHLARRDGALLGALHAAARWDLISQWTRGTRSLHSVRMASLLGDPLLEPRLGITQKRLDGSFEASGAFPLQNRLCWDRGWTTADLDTSCAIARVVYGGSHLGGCGVPGAENVHPVGGSRMMRIEGSHGTGTGRRAAAWRLFRCDLLVERGSLLSYWVRQERDPRGVGRLCVDAMTESGRILSRELRDTSGRPADPQACRYPLGKWNRISVRLDSWQGERIRELFVRYDDPLGPGQGDLPMEQPVPERKTPDVGPANPHAGLQLPGGTFAGYLDQIQIDPGFPEPVLDGDFAVDDDRDRHPDHWFAPVSSADAGEASQATAILDDGPPELWLDPGTDMAGVVSQLLGPFESPSTPQFLRFEARSIESASVEASLRDPSTGGRIASMVMGPLTSAWQEREALLTPGGGSPVILSLAAIGGRVGIRELRFTSAQTTDLAEGEAGTIVRRSVKIGPNPSRGEIHVAWDSRRECPVRLDLLDLLGRRIASWHPLPVDLTRRESTWSLRDTRGRPLPAGAYFVRIVGSTGSETRTIQLVR